MKLKGKKSRDKISWLEIVLTCLFVCLFAYAGYLMFTKLNPFGLNSDVSNEIEFRLYTYKHKTLFPKEFPCGHELLINRPILIWWALYAITHNYLLSYELEVMCVMLLQFAAFWYLFSKLKLERVVRLAVLCIYLCVWNVGHNFQMNGWFDIYSLFVIGVLLTLALRIGLREKMAENGTGGRSKHLICLLLIAAVYGFTSIRLTMSLYAPLVAIDLVICFIDHINGRTFTRKQLITAGADILCLLVNVAAYSVTVHFYSEYFAPLSISIRPIKTWLSWDVLSEQLSYVLASLGIEGSGALASAGGVKFILRGCFAFFTVTAVIWLLKRRKDGQEDFNDAGELASYYISATMVLFLMGIFSGSIAGRYYWASALSVPLVCGAAMDQWMRRRQGKDRYLVCAAVTLGLIALFGVNVKLDMTAFSAGPSVLTQVADYIEQNGYEYVTASYWNAGVIRGYTNGAVDYQHDVTANGDLVERRWVIDMEKYEQPREGVPNILLLTDDEEKAVLGNQVSKRLIEEYGEKVQEIGIYDLYAFTENPFTLVEKIKTEETAGLPGEGVKEKTDVLTNMGFVYANSTINEAGELVTDGTEGSGFYGPYSPSVAGTYDITLHYVVDACEGWRLGTFDVALDAEQIAGARFDDSHTSVTLRDVTIEEGHRFEVRMFAPEGMTVRAQSIEYERIN